MRWSIEFSISTLGATPEEIISKESAVKMIAELDNLDLHLYNTITQADEEDIPSDSK